MSTENRIAARHAAVRPAIAAVVALAPAAPARVFSLDLEITGSDPVNGSQTERISGESFDGSPLSGEIDGFFDARAAGSVGAGRLAMEAVVDTSSASPAVSSAARAGFDDTITVLGSKTGIATVAVTFAVRGKVRLAISDFDAERGAGASAGSEFELSSALGVDQTEDRWNGLFSVDGTPTVEVVDELVTLTIDFEIGGDISLRGVLGVDASDAGFGDGFAGGGGEWSARFGDSGLEITGFAFTGVDDLRVITASGSDDNGLLPLVPSPGAAGVLAIAGLGAGRRRR